jgi:hypothetical protein
VRARGTARSLSFGRNDCKLIVTQASPATRWQPKEGPSMMSFRLWSALAFCAVVGSLTGCAASQTPFGVTGAGERNSVSHRFVHAITFKYTGAKQIFTVPKKVHSVTVVADGAFGGPHGSNAYGGEVTAQIRVSPGERLAIFVGGRGRAYGFGGYNGGGNNGFVNCSPSSASGYCSVGAGGASDVREGGDALSERVVVAAGGGGEGYFAGGAGGGKHGVQGRGGTGIEYPTGGSGGSQTAGGAGGKAPTQGACTSQVTSVGGNGKSGSLGRGGRGGYQSFSNYAGPAGGGGGGGYYGGGGGGGGSCDGSAGGGGGSSYVEPAATHVRDKVGGAPEGNGQITISWVE